MSAAGGLDVGKADVVLVRHVASSKRGKGRRKLESVPALAVLNSVLNGAKGVEVVLEDDSVATSRELATLQLELAILSCDLDSMSEKEWVKIWEEGILPAQVADKLDSLASPQVRRFWEEQSMRGDSKSRVIGNDNIFDSKALQRLKENRKLCTVVLEQGGVRRQIEKEEKAPAVQQNKKDTNQFSKVVLLLDGPTLPQNFDLLQVWNELEESAVPQAPVLGWGSVALTQRLEQTRPFFNSLRFQRVDDGNAVFLSKTSPSGALLPHVEQEPSQCQKSTTMRMLFTIVKMILHPFLSLFSSSSSAKASETTSVAAPATTASSSAHSDKMSSFYATQAEGYDSVRESMLVSRPYMMSCFGSISSQAHCWLDIGGATGRNLHFLRDDLHRFQRIVILDICRELLEVGRRNAEHSFPKEVCDKITWVCADVNDENISAIVTNAVRQREEETNKQGGAADVSFDTVTFSYSLSMIPRWEDALRMTKTLVSSRPGSRVLVCDFDNYSTEGTSDAPFSDWAIKTWYGMDGVRIEAKSREMIRSIYTDTNGKDEEGFDVTVHRFRQRLLGVNIPHYVACCRRQGSSK